MFSAVSAAARLFSNQLESLPEFLWSEGSLGPHSITVMSATSQHSHLSEPDCRRKLSPYLSRSLAHPLELTSFVLDGRSFPMIEEAKPHWGLSAKRSSGTKRFASVTRRMRAVAHADRAVAVNASKSRRLPHSSAVEPDVHHASAASFFHGANAFAVRCRIGVSSGKWRNNTVVILLFSIQSIPGWV